MSSLELVQNGIIVFPEKSFSARKAAIIAGASFHQIGYSSVKYGLKKISFLCFHYILKSHNRELHK